MPRKKQIRRATKSSSKPSWGSDPQCSYCGRSLAGYGWNFDDGKDGYICTATHEETGGNVAFMVYSIVDDDWALGPRS